MLNYTLEQLDKKDKLIEDILKDKTFYLKVINKRKNLFGITDSAEDIFSSFLSEVYLNIDNKFKTKTIKFATTALKMFLKSYNMKKYYSLDEMQENSHFDIATENNQVLVFEATIGYYEDLLFELNLNNSELNSALNILTNIEEYTKEQIKNATELLRPAREKAVKIISYLIEENLKTEDLILQGV